MAFTRIPSLCSAWMTSRHGAPSSLTIGTFTTMFCAHIAYVRACASISNGSLPMTSTLNGRPPRISAISRAPFSISRTPSLSMMEGLVVTPSITPRRSHLAISLTSAVSAKISTLDLLSCSHWTDSHFVADVCSAGCETRRCHTMAWNDSVCGVTRSAFTVGTTTATSATLAV